MADMQVTINQGADQMKKAAGDEVAKKKEALERVADNSCWIIL